MRLTSAHINAIVSKVRMENRKRRELELKKARAKHLQQASSLAIRYWKILDGIPSDMKELLHIPDLSRRDIQKRLLGQIALEEKDIDYADLKNRILLASIDSDSLEEIKRKLNLKF